MATETKINRDEECSFCGLPRHAHWGGPQALAAGRCAGFQSSEITKMRAAAQEMLGALQIIAGFSVRNDETDSKALTIAINEALAAVAKAEGRS